MIDKVAQGKRNRRAGLEFEIRVRELFTKAGWIVSRWQCDADVYSRKIVPAKSNRFRMRTTGFPDFVVIRPPQHFAESVKVILIECKTNGKLTRLEKDKIAVYKYHGFEVEVARKKGRTIAFEVPK